MRTHKKFIVIFTVIAITMVIVATTVYATTGSTNDNSVRIRREKSTTSEVINALPKGEKVEILSEEDGWYQVKYQGNTGWIKKELLDVEDEIGNQNDGTTEGQKTTIKETSLLNIPAIKANVLVKIPEGIEVKVEEALNGWLKVTFEDVSGWIRQESLADSTLKTGYIKVNDTNIRQVANATSNILVKLRINDAVKIVGEEGSWYKVIASGKIGYVSKDLISDSRVDTTTSRSGNLRETNNTTTNTNAAKQTATQSTADAPNASSADTLVNFALQYKGKAYKAGGVGPNAFDCSGFTMFVYKNALGISLPHSSSAQAGYGTYVAKENLQKGDLVFFKNGGSGIGHVGLYIGGGQFIHASTSSTGVIISDINSAYNVKNYVTARRLI